LNGEKNKMHIKKISYDGLGDKTYVVLMSSNREYITLVLDHKYNIELKGTNLLITEVKG